MLYFVESKLDLTVQRKKKEKNILPSSHYVQQANLGNHSHSKL